MIEDVPDVPLRVIVYAQNYAYAAQKPSTEFFKIKMRVYSENEAGYSYV